MGSPLFGGRRRRRPLARALAVVALVLAPLAVGGAAYLSFAAAHDSHGPPALPLATVHHAPRAAHPRPVTYHGRPIPGIALDSVDSFHLRLRKPPRAGLVFDLGNGRVLWRRRPLEVLPIASLTKIMTALIVVQRSRPSDPVRITRAALSYQGSGVGLLPKGRRVRLETLLNGMLIVSGNDAAIALAVHLSGTQHRFVQAMNRRARAWGLRCTHFASADGLESGNRSCPRDLAVLTRMAMREPRIRRIVGRGHAVLRFPIKGGKLFLYGHNPLMRLGYPGTIGLKTGYTDAAGRCFVGVARRGRHRLGVVLLHSPDPGKQAWKLLNAGFASE